MDSLTQIVLGIATAEAVAGKQLRNRTFLYGAILGTLPDLDVIFGRWLSPIDVVAFHRGVSHSLLFFIVMAPLLGALIHRWERPKLSFQRSSWMVFLVLLTHALLDLFTTWSTQFLWPLSQRFAWKTIFVIDPLYTLPFIFCLWMVWKNKLHERRKLWVWRGIGISTTYLMLTVALKLIAVHQFEKALDNQGIVYEGLIVKPSPLNCILWNANVKTTEGFLLADYALTDSSEITFTPVKTSSENYPEVRVSEDYQKLLEITEGWYVMAQEKGRWVMHDLRFGFFDSYNQLPVFAISYEFYQNGEGTLSAREASKEQLDGKAMLKNIGLRILGK
ncbi:MAG: metal-dependent hydrolase [Flavobacterium sp.]